MKFQLLKQRWISKTPVFFKRVQVLGGSIAALSIALAPVPHIPGELISGLATAGGVMAAVAQFAVENLNTTGSNGGNDHA